MTTTQRYQYQADIDRARQIAPAIIDKMNLVHRAKPGNELMVATFAASMGLILIHSRDSGRPLAEGARIDATELTAVAMGLTTNTYSDMETPASTQRVQRALVVALEWWDAWKAVEAA